MNVSDVVSELLDAHVAHRHEELAHKTASCAHVYASRAGETIVDLWRGHAQLAPTAEPVTTEQPVFDLASLTKPLVPATLAMQAIDEGRCALDTPLAHLIPGWSVAPHQRDATFGELLNHTSGLPGWHKYYEDYAFPPADKDLKSLRETITSRVINTPRKPPGTHYAYSDLGYIAIMVLLEQLFEQPLEVLAAQRIFEPLGMKSTGYVTGAPLVHAVATERTPERGTVRGFVHDENTHLLGGVSGHAGVFGTAHDLGIFGEHLLAIDAGHIKNGIVSQRTLKLCWSTSSGSSMGHHLAGWDTPSGERSSAGRGFSHGNTVGHLGFTGTSIWLERASQTCAVLLTNRVHPTRDNARIFGMRVAVHEAIIAPPE